MITYLYWILIIAVASGLFYVVGIRFEQLRIAAAGFFSILLIGLVAYYFHFEQVFVKRYGGVMSIKVPEGEYHIAATWKDDNLWIENYDPKTNDCHFREYSRGNLLQGKVTIRNCNPVAYKLDSANLPNSKKFPGNTPGTIQGNPGNN